MRLGDVIGRWIGKVEIVLARPREVLVDVRGGAAAPQRAGSGAATRRPADALRRNDGDGSGSRRRSRSSGRTAGGARWRTGRGGPGRWRIPWPDPYRGAPRLPSG